MLRPVLAWRLRHEYFVEHVCVKDVELQEEDGSERRRFFAQLEACLPRVLRNLPWSRCDANAGRTAYTR